VSLLDAVRAVGLIPPVGQALKKRYAEKLSKELAEEVADSLRLLRFPAVKPIRGGPGEKAFQGGLGPKKVDVSFADERHGLLLAVSVKTICAEPYGKNLKNRFGDLCTEAITLHMRFPYSVICALFVMPEEANLDITRQRRISTFQRASMLLGTISDREDYSSAGEKFENVTVMLFRPLREDRTEPWVRLFDSRTRVELTEQQYFQRLRDIYNVRNPHYQIGVEDLKAEGEDEADDEDTGGVD
jgi:hypothetical protein